MMNLSLISSTCPYHRLGRVCPGKHLAHSTLTFAAASVLSTFDLGRKLDENHREIEPKREYLLSLIWSVSSIVFPWVYLFLCAIYSQPLDFPCVIKPRSSYAADLIRSSSAL